MAIKSLGVDPTRVTATAEHEIGLEIEGIAGGRFNANRYYYVQAGVAIVKGDSVKVVFTTIDEPGIAIPTTDIGDLVKGVAHVAIPLNNFGFITIAGKVEAVKVATGILAGDILVASDTDGVLEKLVPDIPLTLSQFKSLAGLAAGRGIEALDNESSGLTEVWIY